MSAPALASPLVLLELDDDAFISCYRDLSIEERNALPEDVRARAIARYRELTPWVTASIERAARDQARRKVEPEPPSTPWPAPLDVEALAEREPTPPRSIMPGLPTGYPTLIAGHGGAGKSSITLYLVACIASGRPFFGLPVERRRVLFLSCEDREDVLHWRLSRICAHLKTDLAELRGWLMVLDLVGRDCTLWRADRAGDGVAPAFSALEAAAREADVIVIDGINDVFAGNENDRGHVKAFVNSLLGLIDAERGALILIGHVAKASANGYAAEGYSGSTAWHNAARARWYLRPATRDGDDGERERTGELLLELQKANHGDALSMRFTWDEAAHLFVGELVGGGRTPHLDRLQQAKDELQGVLRALKACAEASPPIVVPGAMQGPRTALNVLSARAEFPDSLRAGRPSARRFWRLIEEMRQSRLIDEIGYRRANRHTASQFVLTTEGMRQCVESR